MSSQSPKPHPLKDKWYVTYFPFVRRKIKGKEFDEQQQPKELDWVTTAEELYATINSFPPFALLPTDDSLIFARNKTDPYFEKFRGGHRISIFTRTKAQGDHTITMVLAAVMGEHLRTLTDGEPVADVVRITHKHSQYAEALSVEVWLRKSEHNEKLGRYFEDLMKAFPGISVAFRPINTDAPPE